MELVSPGIGLIFWMTLSFGIVLFILGKFAWKPILKSLRDREDSIDEALNTANKAREDMKQLKFDFDFNVLLHKTQEDYHVNQRYVLSYNLQEMLKSSFGKSLSGIDKFNL